MVPFKSSKAIERNSESAIRQIASIVFFFAHSTNQHNLTLHLHESPAERNSESVIWQIASIVFSFAHSTNQHNLTLHLHESPAELLT